MDYINHQLKVALAVTTTSAIVHLLHPFEVVRINMNSNYLLKRL